MEKLNEVFAALSHETRRAILARLKQGESRLSDLTIPFNISQTAVSKHVRVLSDADLVIVEQRGRIRYCRLNAEPMKAVTEWLMDYQDFWPEQIESVKLFFGADGD